MFESFMQKFFMQNDLIPPNQSGFKTTGSCINCISHLISITRETYKLFDHEYEVEGVFLDILKVSDKLWHLSLHYKLEKNDISGKL